MERTNLGDETRKKKLKFRKNERKKKVFDFRNLIF